MAFRSARVKEDNMRVVKEENESGGLNTLTFRPESENPEEFKAAVKTWIQANYPNMTWEEFFMRLAVEVGRITLKMA